MLHKLLIISLIVTFSLAEIQISAYILKDGDSFNLHNQDIVFEGDQLKFEISSDIDENVTLSYHMNDSGKKILKQLVLKQHKTIQFPGKDSYMVFDDETANMTFQFDGKDSLTQFHLTANPHAKILDSKDQAPFIPILDDRRIYIDQSKIISNDRGAKEANMIIPKLENSTVVISTQGFIGTGVIIDNGRHILTNYHVVSPDEKNIYIAIKPKTGNNPAKNSYYKAKLLKVDMLKDLALLEMPTQIKQNDIESIKFGTIDQVKKGINIYTMGHPHQYYFAFEYGMLTNILKNHKWNRFQADSVLQYSMNSNRGNSGGAIVNEDLELIGIVAGSDTSGNNLNFAISLTDIKVFLKSNKDVRIEYKSPNDYKNDIIEKGLQKGTGVRLAKVDRNHNGIPDAIMVDIDKDGNWDAIEYDTDEDGSLDRVTRY